MLRPRNLAIAACIFALGAVLAQAQDDELKTVLRKAIQAHGGEQNLRKSKGIVSKFKGTIEVLGKMREMNGEVTLLMPDKVKNTLTFDFDGKEIPVVVVFNGKQMWRSVLGKTEEITDEKVLDETRDSLRVEAATSLPDYLKAPYKLAAVGEAKVKGKDAVGIRISKEGQRDITFYFDKTTHLLVKSEMRVYDPETKQEVNQEKYILDYRDSNGLKTAKRIAIEKDGKANAELEITDTKTYEKLEDSNFAMP
ncbi:MAG TPA: hypothetical protein VFE62_21940 [Gemmataceae bacterium]|nr:hypothetical protein [Gemmataceae bacterium]